MSKRELEKDREQWFSFIESYEEKAAVLGAGALMVTPYGEALIHPWYWEGLGRVGRMAETDAVGAQTNLSFPIEKSLEEFVRAGGVLEKLRLWATFHPEMTTASEFAARCGQLAAAGVKLCAGSVGAPEHLELLRRLRALLPEEIYLWVNKMDGLKRPYTQEEKEAFWEIDPYFIRELTPVPADVTRCRERLFVEGDGRLHTCNISQALKTHWKDVGEVFCENGANMISGQQVREAFPKIYFPEPECGRKFCSCYLAYGGRREFINRMIFGDYPLFRIPRRPKAVFFDIEGTLLLEEGASAGAAKNMRGGRGDTAFVKAGLEALAKAGAKLFFATTLPYEEAVRRCREIRHLFLGGIFSGGAHLRLEGDGTVGKRVPVPKLPPGFCSELREAFFYMDEAVLGYLAAWKKKHGFRVLAYRNEERLYKITLLRPNRRPWKREEAEDIFKGLPVREDTRFYIENNCLQIVSAEADKTGGVRKLCQWLDIPLEEIAAAGNSEEDRAMMELCGKRNKNLPQAEQEFLI